MVFSPVPANQIDDDPTGYVVTRERHMPADEFWIFNVARDGESGEPIIQDGRRLLVPRFSTPPDATQPNFTQTLNTLDARLTQAVQAYNPQTRTFSLWTQHTIKVGSESGVRWYEINPALKKPVLVSTGTISSPGSFVFNGAISPDRRVDGGTRLYGDSFVINYNVSSA